MNKKAEKDRLRPLLFEGVPESFKWAAMDKNGHWWFYFEKPAIAYGCWSMDFIVNHVIKNQPETFLDWTDSLIER